MNLTWLGFIILLTALKHRLTKTREVKSRENVKSFTALKHLEFFQKENNAVKRK